MSGEESKSSRKGAYRVPLTNRILRRILRPIFRGIFHILSNVRIIGVENVPLGEPYVIAMNHLSLFEPPLVVAFWPEPPEAAGAVDLWSKPGISILARMYGGIKVHRGEYDRQAVITMLDVLASGYPLLIAPEGGRSHTPGMRRAHPGAADLIDQAGVPIIPVGIVGSTEDFLEKGLRAKRPTIEMHIGESMILPSIKGRGEARRHARQHNVDQIMYRIAEMMPMEYRGVYDGGALPSESS